MEDNQYETSSSILLHIKTQYQTFWQDRNILKSILSRRMYQFKENARWKTCGDQYWGPKISCIFFVRLLWNEEICISDSDNGQDSLVKENSV